jgi:restriction system protein
VSRDALTVPSKNSLGAISTFFRVPAEAASDLDRALSGGDKSVAAPAPEETAGLEKELFEDIHARALEFIKDRISKLDWDDMQELVAGLLRAMGYKTRVSPAGPDRGKDIVASPDGFGFESPRIVVEVKHRAGTTMGSQEIRSFLGGRHSDDKGLYVSTGGFSKDARYEADRASIPLTLMDADDLVQAVVDYYDRMDIETQRLLPLRKLYWPG